MKKILIFLFLLIIPLGLTPNAHALIIRDDSTGGDCNTVGMWNATSKTCTLTGNVTEGIIINANLITLDGNNFSLIGSAGNDGISMQVLFGVTIKNLVIENFSNGIKLSEAFNNTITNNTIQNIGFLGIDLQSGSVDNIIFNNTVTNANVIGINVASTNNAIQENIVHGNTIGIQNFHSPNNIISKNDIKFNTQSGIEAIGPGMIFSDNIISENLGDGVKINSGQNFTFHNNIISKNIRGIQLSGSNSFVYQNNFTDNSEIGLIVGQETTQVYNNNFLLNLVHAKGAGDNPFNLPEPIGGNYWDDFSHICTNADNDNFCDDPYPFSGGTISVHDNLVWVIIDGWLTKFIGDEDIIVNATSENGAIVNYSVSATKNDDPIPVSCDPLSSSLFPVGNSTVVCTAQTGVVSEFLVTVNPFVVTPCTPSVNDNWIVTESCTLLSDFTIIGNVTVQNNSVVTIPNEVTLNIDFVNFNLTVKSGSGVLIKSGGTIT